MCILLARPGQLHSSENFFTVLHNVHFREGAMVMGQACGLWYEGGEHFFEVSFRGGEHFFQLSLRGGEAFFHGYKRGGEEIFS